MQEILAQISAKLQALGITFTSKPLIIGGLAMEYYGIRKHGADIDLVITNDDYQRLAAQFPHNKKDIWGDLGIVVDEFEIWRSICLLDYAFYARGAIDCGDLCVVSLDMLFFLKVLALPDASAPMTCSSSRITSSTPTATPSSWNTAESTMMLMSRRA